MRGLKRDAGKREKPRRLAHDPMSPFAFHPSALGTLGVELEWMTVDQHGGQQVAAAPALLAAMAPTPRIKAELFASTIEINSAVHSAVSDCFSELAELRRLVLAQPQMAGVGLLSSGTHPFSHWRDQQVSDDPRYHKLLERMGWMARRFNIFGMHVHVGIGDGDRCIRAMNALLPIMHVFLALSANSPFWHGEDTALASTRLKVFEGLSQSGMPFYFHDWADFVACAERLLASGSIDSIREIWWEMRPHPDFGTLEVRISDMPSSLADARALAALIRAEVMTAVAGDAPPVRVHPSLIRENRWRACRYGMQAVMIDPCLGPSGETVVMPLLDWLARRLDWLGSLGTADAVDLHCVAERLPYWRQHGDGAMRQRRMLDRLGGDMTRLVQEMQRLDGWEEGDA